MTTIDLDQEAIAPVTANDGAAFRALVERLSRQSVEKHFDAYGDIAWDHPDMAIDPHDPRWELPTTDPLGATEWYRSQSPEIRAELGLYRVATAMKVGLQFENILKRGLLDFASGLPDGSPVFRYAYHEVIEEAQHGLMFQEFVNRSGFQIRGLPRPLQRAARGVIVAARWFPELFFIFVLGGEDPIDHIQRETLRRDGVHPLLERIMRIHVTEEARHLSFARHYLKRRVPRLGRVRRTVLSVAAPVTLGVMAALMLRPSGGMVRRYGVPEKVLAEAYGTAEAKGRASASLAKVRRLCVELDLVNPVSIRIWRALGIWADA